MTLWKFGLVEAMDLSPDIVRKKWPHAQPAVTLELLAFCPHVVLCST
jgi:hypothetical protein